jgi:hypothetical protein
MDVDEFFVPTKTDSLVPILQQYDSNPDLVALSIRHWNGEWGVAGFQVH